MDIKSLSGDELKKKLISISVEATKDKSISVAGDFQPKGLTWKRAAAAGAGSLIGSEVSNDDALATAIGAGTGYMAGQYAGTSGNTPPVVVLAASPEKLYVLTTNNSKV